MKVGIDVQSLVRLPRAGMHYHTYEIIRSLAEQNPSDRYYLFFDGGVIDDPGFDRRFVDGLPPNCEPRPLQTVGRTRRTAQLFWLWWHLPRGLAREQVDVFHGFCHTLAHVRRCPTVVTVHDLMPIELVSWTPGDKEARRGRKALLSAIRRATGICVVSESTKRDVQAMFPSEDRPIGVSPNAVRDSLTRAAGPDRLRDVAARYELPDRFLLTLGPDMPRRNYARLVDAMVEAKNSAGSAVLPVVFVGARAWLATRVFRRVAERGVGDLVRFISGVEDDDLAVLYSAATAYVSPSIHEGFCMPVLEAMACGTPVVCSDLPVLREVTAGLAVYFNPEDVPAMSRALVAASARSPIDASERTRLSQAARRYQWSSSAVEVRRLYERVVSGGR